MLTAVLGVAVVGIAVLAAAVLTQNTILAVIVIAISAIGLVLLARDWLTQRRQAAGSQAAETTNDLSEPHPATGTSLDADKFEPDVPYEEDDAEDDDAETETQAANKESD
ncbi:MAG: hypothetical protein QOH57_1126 [Mycobacterium sp.]|nr:hypothetical protein [Mycobacterium sp.]